MAATSRALPVDLVLHPGDNVYECGPDPMLPGAERCAFGPDQNQVAAGYTPPADPSFERLFEKPLAGVLRDGKPVPVLLTLGNHDVAAMGTCASGGEARVIARRRACLEVAHRSPRWSMPGRHWVEDRGPVRFIGIDSNLLKRDYGGFSFDDEVAFVTEAARPCGERLCFIVSHHPSVSAGEHRADATPEYLARVKRIEDGGRPHRRLARRPRAPARAPPGARRLRRLHLRQRFPRPARTSASRPSPRPAPASSSPPPGPASALLEVAAGGGWSYRFVDESGKNIQCCTAPARGPCKPVTCPP